MKERKLFNANEVPLSNDPKRRRVQEKVLRGEKLDPLDPIHLGRDSVVLEIDGYKLKPDHAYRACDEATYELYRQRGAVIDERRDDYKEGGNDGIDWYLGGACQRYGKVIIETPAYEDLFVLPHDNGNGMALDPRVKHIKSSPQRNPVPFSEIRLIKHPTLEVDIPKVERLSVEQIRKAQEEAGIETTEKKVIIRSPQSGAQESTDEPDAD